MVKTMKYSLSLKTVNTLKLPLPVKTYDGLKTINRLKNLWFPAILLLLLLLIAQTIGNKFDGNAGKAWWWFSQTVLPLSLLLLILSVRAQQSVYATVSGTSRWLSILLIVVYYLSIVVTLLFQPLTTLNLISTLEKSTIYLLIFEGLVMTFLGLTFFRSKKAKQLAKPESEPVSEKETDFAAPDGVDTTSLMMEYEQMVQQDQLNKLQTNLIAFAKKYDLPYQDIILSQRNLRQLENDRLVNIISSENYALQKAQITNFLLLKINALKK